MKVSVQNGLRSSGVTDYCVAAFPCPPCPLGARNCLEVHSGPGAIATPANPGRNGEVQAHHLSKSGEIRLTCLETPAVLQS